MAGFEVSTEDDASAGTWDGQSTRFNGSNLRGASVGLLLSGESLSRNTPGLEILCSDLRGAMLEITDISSEATAGRDPCSVVDLTTNWNDAEPSGCGGVDESVYRRRCGAYTIPEFER